MDNYTMNPFAWYNAIYFGLFILPMIYWTLTALGLISDSFDIDGDMDMDGDGDVDADVDAEISFLGSFMGVLNAKKCPLTMALGLLMLSWGVFGYTLNSIILSNIPDIIIIKELSFLTMFFVVLAGSGLAALLLVRRVAPLMARSLPQECPSLGKRAFVGHIAEVSTILKPDSEGMIIVDVGHAIMSYTALLQDSQTPLKRGDKVQIIGYDEEKERFICCPYTDMKI